MQARLTRYSGTRISRLVSIAFLLTILVILILPIPIAKAQTINHQYYGHSSGQTFCTGTCTIALANVQMTAGDLVAFGLSVYDSSAGGCSAIHIAIVSVVDNANPPLNYQFDGTTGCQYLGGNTMAFASIYSGIPTQTGSFTITTTYTETIGGSQSFAQSAIDTSGFTNTIFDFGVGFVACTTSPCSLTTPTTIFSSPALLFSQIAGTLAGGGLYCSAGSGFTALQLQAQLPCNVNGGQYDPGNGMYSTDSLINSPTNFPWILNGAQNGNDYTEIGVAFAPAQTSAITTQTYITVVNNLTLNQCHDLACALGNIFAGFISIAFATIFTLILALWLAHEAKLGEQAMGFIAIGVLWVDSFAFGFSQWVPFFATVAGIIVVALGRGNPQ